MNDVERLALELDRALHGAAWHGPSWREALEGVDRDTAVRRPIPAAHTIAEIVSHASVWFDVVRRRLEGESPQVPDDEDWRPSVPDSDAAWSAAVAASMERGDALLETVRKFPPARLYETRPKVDATWYELVSGELQHVIYHAGQVILLRKTAAGGRT
jgi:uncharacterized damage-inducible protein DinB